MSCLRSFEDYVELSDVYLPSFQMISWLCYVGFLAKCAGYVLGRTSLRILLSPSKVKHSALSGCFSNRRDAVSLRYKDRRGRNIRFTHIHSLRERIRDKVVHALREEICDEVMAEGKPPGNR